MIIIKLYLIKHIEISMVILTIVALLIRSFFGADFYDEGWYLGDYKIFADGSKFLTTYYTQAPGVVFPLSYVYKIFYFFSPNGEYLTIFSRLIFHLWTFIIFFTIIYILKKYDNFRFSIIPICFIFALVGPIRPLFYINYNSIGLYYSPLIFLLVYTSINNKLKKKFCFLNISYIFTLIAGYLSCRSALATPATGISFFLLFLLLAYKNFKFSLCYLCGIFCFLFMILFSSYEDVSSINKFINSLLNLVNNWPYKKIKHYQPISSDIKMLFIFVAPCIFSFCILIIINHVKKIQNEEDNTQNSYNLLKKLTITLVIISAFFMLIGKYSNSIGFIWFIYLFAYFDPALQEPKKKRTLNFLALINLFLFCSFLVSSFTPIFGFLMRRYCYFVLPTICSIYYISILFSNKFKYLDNCLGTFFVICSIVSMYYFGLYRVTDNKKTMDISNNSRLMTHGIYKGIYIDEITGGALEELEHHIRKITNKNDLVLFRDWASYGYAMTDAKSCTPSALAGWQYFFSQTLNKVNDDILFYNYFSNFNIVPTKIIYITTNDLKSIRPSIEDEDFNFNNFVINFYEKFDEYTNDNFQIQAYKILDKDRALKYCKASVKD